MPEVCSSEAWVSQVSQWLLVVDNWGCTASDAVVISWHPVCVGQTSLHLQHITGLFVVNRNCGIGSLQPQSRIMLFMGGGIGHGRFVWDFIMLMADIGAHINILRLNFHTTVSMSGTITQLVEHVLFSDESQFTLPFRRSCTSSFSLLVVLTALRHSAKLAA